MSDTGYLDRPGSEISDSKMFYPNGTYQLRVAAVAIGSFTDKNGKEVENVGFNFAVGAPQEDVDQDLYGEVIEEVQGERIWRRWNLDTHNRRVEFKKELRKFGIDPDAAGATLRDQAKLAKGRDILGFVGRKTYTKKDGTVVDENEVKSLTPIDQPQEEAA